MNHTSYQQLIDTPVGTLQVEMQDRSVRKIYLGRSISEKVLFNPPKNDEKITIQFREYFSGERKKIKLPLNLKGTPFEQAVWRETAKIPYGKVRTYKDIAKAIGKPNAARAVGNALKRNPIPILIPCHRVVASNGIGGYSIGLPIKMKLLSLETGQKTFTGISE